MEGADRAGLQAPPLRPLAEAAVQAINRYLGAEEIELG